MLVWVETQAHVHCERTIVDYDGSFAVATRPSFFVDGPEAFKRRFRHAPELGWRFGWIAPCELGRLVDS
jgi:hypothetical protein